MNLLPFLYPSSRFAPAAVLSLSLALAHAADPFAENIRKTDALTPEQEQKSFHLPPGFQVQLVASEPEIGKPMNMAFDAHGRLWVTQSREYPYAAPLDKPARDNIKVLSDFDEHGHARKVTTFAEGLNIPIGLYPYKNGVIAFSIPNIYYFQDSDGDGKADKKEIVLGRFGFERDVHGLTSAFRRGFDGWLYADHGYNNDSTLTAKDGSTIKLNSGNCYRFKIDGSRVEQHSWGQVNPFGLMFDPIGDLWSADCHSSPVYQLLRGAYYPSFGKPHDGLGFAPNICAHSHGSTAIAGMVFYAADNFPPEFRENVFVGNVMTCRINRDSLVEYGSTRIATEKPDFLQADDPWFRPVDLQLGPDGALYVADFYNRIIGHYEVPLDHPGRDRERGRIWRIVYGGTNSTPALTPRLGKFPTSPAPIATLGNSALARYDLARSSTKDLLIELGNPNITRRMLAMNYLIDELGAKAIAPVKKLLREPKASSLQKSHGLWILHRLNDLDESLLAAAARDPDRVVRVHALRVLSETQPWTKTQTGLALNGLKDSDPFVQRAAADAIGCHSSIDYLQPLMALAARTPATDAQLVYVARRALRNQVLAPKVLAQLVDLPLGQADSRRIAEVALGIPTADSGHFLLRYIQRYPEEREKLTRYLSHIARYAPESEMGRLADFTRSKFADSIDFQMSLFKSLQDGASQRGAPLASAAREWGADLAERLLASAETKESDWRNLVLPGSDSANPWFVQTRISSDGDKSARFLCSLPPDGERLTGVLRSSPFTIPAKLSFFMAGHDGPPNKPLQKKNLIRLLDDATDEVLAESRPPRNDTAQPFSWDLTKFVGRKGVLELVDGDTGSAFAWLAAGRFDPPVAALPKLDPSQMDLRSVTGAEIAGQLGLVSLVPRLALLFDDSDAQPNSRAAAAKALSLINPKPHIPRFARVLTDSAASLKLREKVAVTLGEMNLPAAGSALLAALAITPWDLQKEIALSLASTADGAELLLQAVTDGKASPRLLQERNIKDRLTASKPANVAARLEKLTLNLPPASVERQKLIQERNAGFSASQASAAQGSQTFKQYCALCHAIDGQGPVIGPQVDGIGARGLERLVEDILDPSRNVDRAFRTTLLVMKDGDVQSGLFRREEGENLVLAQSTGKEISIPKKDVQERRESETSLMPDNFSEAIPKAEFNNLLAFLLSKRPK